MEKSSVNCPEINFISHQLLECKAELVSVNERDVGGEVTFEIKVETPSEPAILNQNDFFQSIILLKCTGIGSKSKKTSFRASCKMSGLFEVAICPAEGIATANSRLIFSLSANCLYPLVAQCVEEIISKMGFKSIEIPPLFPKQLVAEVKRKTKKAKETAS